MIKRVCGDDSVAKLIKKEKNNCCDYNIPKLRDILCHLNPVDALAFHNARMQTT
jgi:hypothetical protein